MHAQTWASYSAVYQLCSLSDTRLRKVFQIGTVRYNWPMSVHASQAFSIAHCTDSEDLPRLKQKGHYQERDVQCCTWIWGF